MKLQVLKSFYDKVEKKDRNVGDTFSVTAERGKEILSHDGYAVEVPEEKTKGTKSE